MKQIAKLFDWLVDGAPGATTAVEVIDRIGHDLRAGGVSVDRIGVFVTTLHPTVVGRAFWWEEGKATRVLELTTALQQSPVVKASPVALVSATKKELRRKLSAGVDQADFAVYHELVADGFTDLICFPIVFLRGETHVVTFATRSDLGFTDEQIALIRNVVRPLARITEIFALHRTAANLLDTYVGRNSGERILAGRIFKGDIETIRAVIWFSDLRGFTERTARQTPRETIDMLNALFEAQVPAIQKGGGEILKFIGDGLLAIFPYGSDRSPGAAAAKALTAADEAFAALAKQNEGAQDPMQFGLALHVGEISYGNIGGASRLDFTAIGPAVNIAARLEALTGKIGKRLVLSEDFAKHVDRPLENLGAFDLKGVPAPQQVYALVCL
ncbi:MAG: adenylate/guanylate cyclase domain-containing protein [Polyangiaceae bacterium]